MRKFRAEWSSRAALRPDLASEEVSARRAPVVPGPLAIREARCVFGSCFDGSVRGQLRRRQRPVALECRAVRRPCADVFVLVASLP